MSDVTRPTGGGPAERGPQTPDARGETSLGTGPNHGDPARDAGADRGDLARDAGPVRDAGAGADRRDSARDVGAGSGETVRDIGPARGSDDAAPGARSDHAVGAREEAAPQLRTSGGTPGGTSGGATGAERVTEAAPTSPGTPLVPREECDKYGERLHHAVSGFVDDPRGAVEEADRVLEEIAARFTDAVTRRRRTLRGSWQTADADKKPTTADTEQLRLALRDYRELSDRLMHL
jgi:hypothetical protein